MKVKILLWNTEGNKQALEVLLEEAKYDLLAIFLWRALRSGANLRVKISILVVVVWFVCAIFAATDEFHQSFIPSRTASPNDVVIDIFGVVIGLTICMGFALRINRKSEI